MCVIDHSCWIMMMSEGKEKMKEKRKKEGRKKDWWKE